MSEVSALVSEIKAVNDVVMLVKKQLENGFQAGADISAVIAGLLEEPLKSELEAAFKNASEAVAEVKAIDAAGLIAVAGEVVQEVLADVKG